MFIISIGSWFFPFNLCVYYISPHEILHLSWFTFMQSKYLNSWNLPTSFDYMICDFYMSLTFTMEKAMAPHSSTLAWKIPWVEEPAAVHGVAKSRTRLSDFTFTFHFCTLEKEMATHSSVLAWRILGMGEPGELPSMGSHRAGHDWSDLAAAAAVLNHDSSWDWSHTKNRVGILLARKTEEWLLGRPPTLSATITILNLQLKKQVQGGYVAWWRPSEV